MKLAVLSDVHSNLEALQAVLQAIDARGADALYCLGDVVGYGADPAACVDLIRERCVAVVRGNHDEAVALDVDVKALPKDGRAAALHNREQLTPDQLQWLGSRPLVLEAEDSTFVHAAPLEPDRWPRIDSYQAARAQFDHFRTDVCFVGHTHIPAVLADKLGVLRVRPGHRYLINVGSVGQPRDANPRAAFAFFDTETFEHELVRVPYAIEKAAGKIVDAGLPRSLARRLHKGQ